MQAALLYLFFLTACGFAQDDDISANVEDLQRELIAERAKNRDLNQTISDILERMAEMEKNIISNEGTISENQRKIDMVNVYVATLSEEVDSNKEDIEFNQLKTDLLSRDVEDLTDDVAAVQDNVVEVAADVEMNSADITTLATFGTWCGYQDSWTTVGTITYDSLTFSDSNMNNEQVLTVTSVIIIWILIFVTFQESSLCLCLEHGG